MTPQLKPENWNALNNNIDRRKATAGKEWLNGFVGGLILGLVPFLVFLCLTTKEADVIAWVDRFLK